MTWLRQLLEAEGDERPDRVPRVAQGRPVRGRGVRLHAAGEVKNLSAGSTPLDFAYAVHTDVGHRCVGAKVNGKIVPLHYQLKSGDIVEILTVEAGARAVARLARPWSGRAGRATRSAPS